MKIMKILEFHARITKIKNNNGIPFENLENHENPRIPLENNDNHENLEKTKDNKKK